jgi:hypothetical protein
MEQLLPALAVCPETITSTTDHGPHRDRGANSCLHGYVYGYVQAAREMVKHLTHDGTTDADGQLLIKLERAG